MKYIIIDQEISGMIVKTPVIFPNRLVHKDVANVIMALLKNMNENYKNMKVTGAGDACIKHINTSGRSETLGIESGDNDAGIIATNDYIHVWPKLDIGDYE